MGLIGIGEQAFAWLNYPLITFNIVANVFYVWVLFLSRRKLKQPLNVLLRYLSLITIFYCVCVVVMGWSLLKHASFLYFFAFIILGQFSHSSTTCYVWLNFYYYMSIVPAKRGLMVWMKKNIRSVIYMALIGDTMLYSLNGALTSTQFAPFFTNHTQIKQAAFFVTRKILFGFIHIYIFVCVLIMMVSSFSTARYLGEHIRNFAKGSSGLTSPKIQSQIRVTVTGVLQGLFHVLYYVFFLTDFISFSFTSSFYLSGEVTLSANTIYFSFTTVNIGIGQAVIRQRAADVFVGLRELLGVKDVAKDVGLKNNIVTFSDMDGNEIKDEMS